MIRLPAALQPLADYRQFVVVKLEPDPKRPGKTNKFPLNPINGWVSDAHDPAIWLTANEAIGLANYWGVAVEGGQHGHVVGFVITKQDPFWCLDIDGARQPDGTWSTQAQTFLQALPGCAVEKSSSGRGLHIWGSGAASIPDHGVKNTPLNVEFYTSGRFMALGLDPDSATGNAALVQPAVIPLVQHYFPPKVKSDEIMALGWTTEPGAGWSGPQDDDDLIRRAMAHQSGHAGAFGTSAHFSDIWTANAEALGRAYPPSNAGESFNRSSADMALATALSFWTGGNCERIERLMRKSALVRDKWDSHDTYLRELTIMNAVAAKNGHYCVDRPKEVGPMLDAPTLAPLVPLQQLAPLQPLQPLPPLEPLVPLTQAATIHAPVQGVAHAAQVIQDYEMGARGLKQREVKGDMFLAADDQRNVFEGCVFVLSENKVLVPGGEMLDQSRFNSFYGGYTFILDQRQEKTTNKAWDAYTLSSVLRPPLATATCFKPKMPFGVIIADSGRRLVNTYVPLTIARMVGDPTPFLDHLRRVLPDERDQMVLLSWMASAVQNKGTKFSWAPVIQGVEGNGKSFFSKIMTYCIGARYTHFPRASQTASNFNSWMAGKLLYCIEDIHTRHDINVLEELKPLITQGEGLTIEKKGVDQMSTDVCGNFMFNMNSKKGLPKTRNDRRFAPLFTAQQEEGDLTRTGMTPTYFRQVWRWLDQGGYAIVHELLATFPLDPVFDPAQDARRAPETSSTVEALSLGRGRLEQEVLEAIDAGMTGFQGGWISSWSLEALLATVGKGVRLAREDLQAMMATIGFVPHPGLPGGRASRPLLGAPLKPILYVLFGSEQAALTGPAIEAGFLAAQAQQANAAAIAAFAPK